MATRMQQRRGTASQWTSANPVLNAGEMGWESDTNKFKIGDGTNHWADIDYFADINSTVNPAFGSSITFEGATADSYETVLQVTDPTADRTITLPNATGTVVLADGSGNVTVSGDLTVSGTTTTINSTTINATTGIIFEGLTADAFETTLTVTDPTADRTITFQDATGTVVLRDSTDTLTNKSISLGSNTVTSTLAQLNTAVSDADVASLAGTETLTNKTINIASNTLTGVAPLASPTFTGTVTLPSGTVTSTMIADGTILNEDINASAAIALSKLATDPLARANHTGSQAASTISDFNEAAQDAVGGILGTGLTYNDSTNEIGVNAGEMVNKVLDAVSGNSYGLVGTSTYLDVKNTNGYNKEIELDIAAVKTQLNTDGYITTSSTSTLTNKTLTSPVVSGLTLSDSSIIIEGSTADAFETTLTITDPTADRTITFPDQTGTVALTSYVDAATAGLNVHASVQAATTANITLASAVENGDTLDGVILATGNRVLVKNQTDKTENGVYLVAASGAPSRADDYNTTPEVDAGDFVFVEAGTTNGKTGWIQTNTIATIGSDNIEFTQFSGVGTYSAGTGLTLTGTTFSINTGTTADLSTAQTLTNKTVALGSNTVSGTLAQFNSAVTDADFASLSGTETLTNKSISMTTNTITGTFAEFNTAVTDHDLVSLTSTSTLTNKTLSSAVATTALTLNATAELRLADTDSSHYVGFKSPATVTSNKIWTLPAADGTAGQTLSTDGSGTLSWAAASSGGAAFSEFMLIGA